MVSATDTAVYADRSIDAPAQSTLGLPLRNLCLTFALTVGTLALAGWMWGATGYEIAIVSLGWPHVILGFIFYFGKVLRGEARARTSFVLLSLATLIFWSAHYAYTITGLISIYFVYHVFRDEVFIYFQTRARHRLRHAISVAGFVPFILLMFLVTDPRPQHYRQDLRRVELTGAQMSASGWTLIEFKPVSYSEGRDYYFYLQAPKTAGVQGYTTLATVADTERDGEIRISDRQWNQAADLVFKPYYAGDSTTGPESPDASTKHDSSTQTIQVLLTGGHNVGQTFKAERANLAGVWIPTERASGANESVNFVLHLTPDTSLPLPPLSNTMQGLRLMLVLILLGLALWKALPHFKRNREFWLYFAFLVAVFAVLQKIIKGVGGSDYALPVMFQLVVVFHYISWYVFSFDKLRAFSNSSTPATPRVNIYERLLLSLRRTSNFTLLVIALNLLSVAGCLWYYKLDGPPLLRFGLDYNYFLYILVFHVTFSFGPKQGAGRSTKPQLQINQTPAAAN